MTLGYDEFGQVSFSTHSVDETGTKKWGERFDALDSAAKPFNDQKNEERIRWGS